MATYCITLIEMTSDSRVSSRTPASPERRDFIREIVAADVREGRASEVVTRFPPEPNGYLHLGHPKAIALNFGIAQELGGRGHLRFDDTNPIGEEQEYIDSIQEDIRWLGFDWGEHLYFASDYFHQLYDWAVHLIGLVSSKRKWQRPPSSWAIPKLSAIALGWPRWRYPFGSGGKRVTTFETLPSRTSAATISPM